MLHACTVTICYFTYFSEEKVLYILGLNYVIPVCCSIYTMVNKSLMSISFNKKDQVPYHVNFN